MGSGGPRGLQNRRSSEQATAGSIPASSEFLEMKKPVESSLAQLPQIERLLEREELICWFARLSHPLVARLAAERLLPGVDLGRFDPAWQDTLLINITEQHDRAQLDRLVEALAAQGA